MFNMQTNISETFKSTRLAYGKSQEEFAEMIGCSRVSLSMYETGKIKNPGADKYDKLLKLKEQINQGPGPQAGPERTFHQTGEGAKRPMKPPGPGKAAQGNQGEIGRRQGLRRREGDL